MVDTIDDDKKKAETDDQKKAEENLAKKDTTNWTEEQKNDYIEKLKDENARRRIANKKTQEELDKREKALTDAQKTLDESMAKLKEFEEKEKQKDDKDKSENEKLQAKVNALKEKIAKNEADMQSLNTDLADKKSKLKMQSRETFAERLISKLNFEFSSDYEREGFLNTLVKTNADNEFLLNDDEVVLKVKDFVKDKKKVPNTPGPSNQTKMTDTPIAQEIQALLAKKTLTDEDNKRLDTLIEEIDKRP